MQTETRLAAPMQKLLLFAVYCVWAAAALPLLFSLLSPMLPLADSVAHFRMHLLAFLLLATVTLFALSHWLMAGLSVCLVIFGALSLSPALPSLGLSKPRSAGPEVTVVQFNVNRRNRRTVAIAELIRSQGADIVTLQEISPGNRGLLTMLKPDFPYQIECHFKNRHGVAVLSRYPQIAETSRGCRENLGLVWLRVDVGGRPVSVASLHLHWPYPFQQGAQIRRLQQTLRNLPRPLIVGGDFNAAPWSNSVRQIADATGTRVPAGVRFSFRPTLGGWSVSSGLPIDHILLPDVLTGKLVLGPSTGSDHLPIVARLSFEETASHAARADGRYATR